MCILPNILECLTQILSILKKEFDIILTTRHDQLDISLYVKYKLMLIINL